MSAPPNRESLPSAPSMQVVAAAAGEYVVAGGAGLHAGGARGSDTDDRVGEVVADEDVVAVAADEGAEVGMDDVLFGSADPAAVGGLGPVGEDGDDPVRAAVDDVDPLLLDGGVGEGVRAGVPEDLVVAESGDDRVVAGVAVDHRHGRTPRCCGRRRCCRSPRRRRAARGRRRPSCRRRRGRGSCRCPPACRRRRCRCRPGRPRGSCRPRRCRSRKSPLLEPIRVRRSSWMTSCSWPPIVPPGAGRPRLGKPDEDALGCG